MTEPTVVRAVEPERVSIVGGPVEVVTIREPAHVRVVTPAPERIAVAAPGPVGPQGREGPRSVYVTSTAPVAPPETYLWVQTGLGADGTGFTLWLEDGLA